MSDAYNPAYVPSGPANRDNLYSQKINNVRLAKCDESKSMYMGTVGCVPGGPVEGNFPPTNISLSNNSVPEDFPVLSVIGFFTTADPDIGDTFTYSLISNPGAFFSISGANLVLSLPLDFSLNTQHNIVVRSTDQGALFVDKAFTIFVTEVGTSIGPTFDSLIITMDSNVETWDEV